METIFNVTHEQVLLMSSYEQFTGRLESLVKMLDSGFARESLGRPEELRSYLEELQEPTGLILFTIQHHGDALNLYRKPRKAKQYVIGNPLVAVQMTVHDIRAALYAPLRMIVYESEDGRVFAEYDLPSSLFGQFGNAAIDQVGASLDGKLLNAITLADKAGA